VMSWSRGSELIGRYMVNTTQPRPHGLTHITALAFSHVQEEGERPLLLTADKEGGVKTWTVRQSKKSEQGAFRGRLPPITTHLTR
jgi:NET1-associated nuclear protein 1 (U3 small nucleolar RNA-associated protein 17)